VSDFFGNKRAIDGTKAQKKAAHVFVSKENVSIGIFAQRSTRVRFLDGMRKMAYAPN